MATTVPATAVARSGRVRLVSVSPSGPQSSEATARVRPTTLIDEPSGTGVADVAAQSGTARAFYAGVLGMTEVAKPVLRTGGHRQLHMVDPDDPHAGAPRRWSRSGSLGAAGGCRSIDKRRCILLRSDPSTNLDQRFPDDPL